MSAAGIVIAKALEKVAREYVIHWATKQARVRGEWRGIEPTWQPVCEEAAIQAGYSSKDECRLYIHHPTDPMYFAHESGYDYMFDTPLVSDGGSTPKIARSAFKSWADLDPWGRFWREFLNHDADYRDAGCFVRLPREEANRFEVDVPFNSDKSVWTWMPLTRRMSDTLLFQMMPSSGGRNGEVNAIFRALRLGGGAAWRHHRERAAKSAH